MCCCGPTCCTMCRGLFFLFIYFFLDHIALTCADLVIETMRVKQKAKKQRAHTHTTLIIIITPISTLEAEEITLSRWR